MRARPRNFTGQLNHRDLVPDFQSILVPGFAFAMSAWALLFLCYFSIISMLAHYGNSEQFDPPAAMPAVTEDGKCCEQKEPAKTNPSESLMAIFEGAKLEIFFFISVLSFTAGKILYRLGEKTPDSKSIRHLTKITKEIEDELASGRWVFVRPKEEATNGEKVTSQPGPLLGAEFPYGNLAGYLRERRLDHLSLLIPWRQDNQTGVVTGTFSQHFIRSIRTRLRYFAPDQCWRIDRVEAHIRMIASTWYSARLLTWLGFAAAAIGILNLSVSVSSGPESGWASTHWVEEANEHLLPFFLSAVICAASWLAKKRIENCFHLQRVWGLVILLETVYSAMLEVGEIIIQDFELREVDLEKLRRSIADASNTRKTNSATSPSALDS